MAQSWPGTLQDKFNEANFRMKKGETVLRTDMDVGPTKTRRRFTKGVDVYTASIYLTQAQYAIFDTFYDTTLNGGTLPFEFTHPITQAVVEYRFKSSPEYTSIGGGNWIATFELEVLP